jgi:hypothetical protein
MNNAAGNIIHILADLPDFLRKQMLQNRLKEFYEMSDEEKRETISMALSEFDAEKRGLMFQTYCREILANPRSIIKLDFKSLTTAFVSLDQGQRERLTDSLHEVLLGLPNGSEILKLIPEHSLKTVGLKDQ